MKALFSPRTAALTLAMVTTFSLTACQMPAKKVDASAPVVMQPSSPDNLIQRELGEGLYEMAYLPAKMPSMSPARRDLKISAAA